MKIKKQYVRRQTNYSIFSIRKILFYLALFFQINQLLNQVNFNKKLFESQNQETDHNSLLFSTLSTQSQEIILPLFICALMPNRVISAPITYSVMLSLANLPMVSADFSRAFKKVGDMVTKPLSDIIRQPERRVARSADEISRAFAHNIGHEARLTIQESDKVLSGLIQKFGEEANQFVVNLNDAGNILIERAGNEFRVSADEVLQKLFSHSQALLSIAGYEARLTINEIGKETRLTFQEFSEVTEAIIDKTSNELQKVISHNTNEIMKVLSLLDPRTNIEDVFYTLKRLFLGLSDYHEASIELTRHIYKNGHNDLVMILAFIKRQNILSAHEKYSLYIYLIQSINRVIDMPAHTREIAFLTIGLVAISDNGLIDNAPSFLYPSDRDYRADIIKSIPFYSIKDMLLNNQVEMAYRMLQLPMPSSNKITEVGLLSFSLTDFVPTDYVECDGSEYSVKDMPELYESMGQTYGYRYDTATKQDYFRVPDLRDYFLRMASPTNKVGVFQRDTTRMPNQAFVIKEDGSHTHDLDENGLHGHEIIESGEHKHSFWGTQPHREARSHVPGPNGKGEDLGGKETDPAGKHNHKLSQNGEHTHVMKLAGGHMHAVSGGDEETRPKNIAVKCLIRYRSTDLQVEEIRDELNTLQDTVQTMQNQYQSQNFMSFFAGTATTVAIAASAAFLFRR